MPTTIEPALGAAADGAADAVANPAGHASETAAAAAPGRPARVRRRWWPWVLLAFALLVLAVTAGAAALLVSLIGQASDGVQVTVYGQEVLGQVAAALTRLAQELTTAWPWLGRVDWHWSLQDLSVGGLTVGLLVLVVGLALAVLSLLTLVPLVVLGVLAGATVAVLAALLLLAALLALVLSPLWLPLWGLVWWWRRKPLAVPAAAV